MFSLSGEYDLLAGASVFYHSSTFETFIRNLQLLQFDYSTCPLIMFVCCSVKTQFNQDLYLGCELVSGHNVHFSQSEGEFWRILNLFPAFSLQ